MSSTALLGWLGAALSMTLPWPQVWRTCVKGRTGGLSATACWLGLAMPFGWITYGLLAGEAVQVVTNTVNGAAGLAVLVTVLIKQPDIRTGRKLLATAGAAAAVLTAAAASVAVAALTPATGAQAAIVLGLILAGTSFVSAIPQPLSLLRDRTQDLSGLSPLRWRLAAAACASWMTYGLTTGQTAVWLSALVGLTSALIVCWVLFAASRVAPAVTAPAVSGAPTLSGVPAVSGIPAIAATLAFAGVPAAAGTWPVPAPRGVVPVVRPARGAARVVRPASVTASAFPPAVVRPVSARVVRPAAAVTRSARPVSGAPRPAPARVARPARAAARPVRGVARVATA